MVDTGYIYASLFILTPTRPSFSLQGIKKFINRGATFRHGIISFYDKYIARTDVQQKGRAFFAKGFFMGIAAFSFKS